MTEHPEIISLIALSMGAAWASGINLYAALFVLGWLGSSGNIVLPEQLMILTEPVVMAAAAFMYMVEFFADKTPGLDTGWDAIHTFVRIPAGAVLAANALGDVSPAMELAAGLVGGALATTSHLTKAGSRVLINTSPEPVTNWSASISEDVLVIAGLWTALHYPVAFLILLVLMVLLMAWLLPRIWRGIRLLAGKVRGWFAATKVSEPTAPTKALPPSPPPARELPPSSHS